MKRTWDSVMIVVVLGVFGCTASSVNMVDEHTFLSTHEPKLRIEVASGYTLKKDSAKRYAYEFINEEEHRYILIRYTPKPVHTTNIDYFENPAKWIFYAIPNCDVIDKGEAELFGQKWFYRDIIHHPSSAQCAMVREMGCFTPSHAVLKVLYLQDLPPYKCSSWEGVRSLGPEQQAKFDLFLKNHTDDIRMSAFAAE